MNRVAESMVAAEKRLGIDSVLCNVFEETNWDHMLDCDVHVPHTWFPELYKGKSMRRQLTKPLKVVFVGHGTPEFIFESSVQEGKSHQHAVGDSIMLYMYWLQNADAIVTFWPRHKWIYDSMLDKGRTTDLVPLGVDREFWAGGVCHAKFGGSPSLLTSENPHFIKSPFDLITAWPYVYRELDGASLHALYLVTDLHRMFAPWMNRNGAAYGMHWSPQVWNHIGLRDVLKSVDYYIGLVRYGDFNRMSLEANAAGTKSISYRGNPYSDFWLPEGDQRDMAHALTAILKGDVAPRADKQPVPDFLDTAKAMQAIYERLLG